MAMHDWWPQDYGVEESAVWEHSSQAPSLVECSTGSPEWPCSNRLQTAPHHGPTRALFSGYVFFFCFSDVCGGFVVVWFMPILAHHVCPHHYRSLSPQIAMSPGTFPTISSIYANNGYLP